MRIQTSIIAGVTILLISVGLIYLAPTVKVQSSGNIVQKEIPVIVKPLKVGDETVPVEIQCEPVLITEPDTLDFSCVLVNKTNKSIRASGVRYSVIYESNGKQDRIDRLDTAIMFIHPDLSEVKKPLEPGGKLHVLAPGPIVQHDAVFKALELEPVYLEFSDGTTAGTNAESIELINQVREGAALYKDTLRREYVSKGKSVEAILPRLQENITGENDQNSWNLHQRGGANAYRRFLQGTYEKDGLEGVRKILDK